MINMYNLTQKIENFNNKSKLTVLGYNTLNNNCQPDTQIAYANNGIKQCIKLILNESGLDLSKSNFIYYKIIIN